MRPPLETILGVIVGVLLVTLGLHAVANQESTSQTVMMELKQPPTMKEIYYLHLIVGDLALYEDRELDHLMLRKIVEQITNAHPDHQANLVKLQRKHWMSKLFY